MECRSCYNIIVNKGILIFGLPLACWFCLSCLTSFYLINSVSPFLRIVGGRGTPSAVLASWLVTIPEVPSTLRVVCFFSAVVQTHYCHKAGIVLSLRLSYNNEACSGTAFILLEKIYEKNKLGTPKREYCWTLLY